MCIKELLQKYGVDLAVWAHEHSYERLFPTFNRTVIPGHDPEDPYDNPGATVHITTGSAGCRERTDPFMKDIPEWSAFRFDQNQSLNGILQLFSRSSDYGYTKMFVSNSTHLRLQQISADQDGKVIDEIWIIQDNHVKF